MPESVYIEDAVVEFTRRKRGDLAKMLQARAENQIGSGWSLTGVVNLLIATHTEAVNVFFLYSDSAGFM
jgi:hypothetical protein